MLQFCTKKCSNVMRATKQVSLRFDVAKVPFPLECLTAVCIVENFIINKNKWLLERIWDACHEVTFLESAIICAFECPLHENNTLLSFKTKFIQDSSIHQWQTSLAKCCVVPTSIHDFSLFVVFGLVQWMAVLKLLALSFLSLCASLRWCQHSYEILVRGSDGLVR